MTIDVSGTGAAFSSSICSGMTGKSGKADVSNTSATAAGVTLSEDEAGPNKLVSKDQSWLALSLTAGSSRSGKLDGLIEPKR